MHLRNFLRNLSVFLALIKLSFQYQYGCKVADSQIYCFSAPVVRFLDVLVLVLGEVAVVLVLHVLLEEVVKQLLPADLTLTHSHLTEQ